MDKQPVSREKLHTAWRSVAQDHFKNTTRSYSLEANYKGLTAASILLHRTVNRKQLKLNEWQLKPVFIFVKYPYSQVNVISWWICFPPKMLTVLVVTETSCASVFVLFCFLTEKSQQVKVRCRLNMRRNCKKKHQKKPNRNNCSLKFKKRKTYLIQTHYVKLALATYYVYCFQLFTSTYLWSHILSTIVICFLGDLNSVFLISCEILTSTRIDCC